MPTTQLMQWTERFWMEGSYVCSMPVMDAREKKDVARQHHQQHHLVMEEADGADHIHGASLVHAAGPTEDRDHHAKIEVARIPAITKAGHLVVRRAIHVVLAEMGRQG